MIRIAANPSSFEQAEAHLVETMFYDQWAPSRESSVSKPRGTFVPKWEDVQGVPEPDLRELLAQKKKSKEAPAAETDDTPQCVRVRGPNGRIVYKLCRYARPTSEILAGLTQEGQRKSLACCVAQKSSGEESNKEKDKKIMVEKEVQVMAVEEFEEVDLWSGSQEPRPISISASLIEKEKLELILLLKEFRDVFAWDYSEMPGLDPRLMVHMLNVDLEAKPMAQPARVFHIEIEVQIVKKV